jgi:succinate dehydrogenase / fumarate reductase flavoprotein subunit
LADVDITKEAMEVGPTCHYMMGGVRVDAETQESTVPGLFAAGECAAGMHGSNRLGGNSLSDLLVFGRRAGRYAAEHALGSRTEPAIDGAEVDRLTADAIEPFSHEAGHSPYEVQRDLQETMHTLVGIIRTADELDRALVEIAALKERAAHISVEGNRYYNPGWHLALDLDPMLTVSECITRAALEREESRGGHTREDFPGPTAEFGRVNVVIRRTPDGELSVTREPLPQMPDELRTLFEETKAAT